MVDQLVRRVLVVAEPALISKLIRPALVRRGFAVLCETSPGASLAHFQASRPPIDLVVIDMDNPLPGPLDLASELARIQPNLPVLYLAGDKNTIARASIEMQSPESVLQASSTEEQLIERVMRKITKTVPLQPVAEDQVWDRLLRESDRVASGTAILYLYEHRQSALAAGHVAILRASGVSHWFRRTNSADFPYSALVLAHDASRARELIEQVSSGKRLTSAA